MGWNTTIVILNDGLDAIASDPNVGKNIADAALQAHNSSNPISVGAGNHCNPISVVESHHADSITVIAVGGNGGQVLGYGGRFDATPEQILATLAASMGYVVSKRPARRRPAGKEKP